MVALREQVTGVLLGGALGDALGAPFEGRAADDSRVLPSRGVFTDDTELTLATCEAIVAARGLDPEAVAKRYAAWFRDGRVHGAGSSTTKALRDLTEAPTGPSLVRAVNTPRAPARAQWAPQ